MPVSMLFCPHCGQPMTLPHDAMPTSLECPHCDHSFSVNLPAGDRGVRPPQPYSTPRPALACRIVDSILTALRHH